MMSIVSSLSDRSTTYTLVKFQLVKNGIKVTKYMLFFRISYSLYINISTGLSQALSTSRDVCVTTAARKICLKISRFDFAPNICLKISQFDSCTRALHCSVQWVSLFCTGLHCTGGRWNGESKV